MTSQIQSPELYQVSGGVLGIGGSNNLQRSLANHLRIGISDKVIGFSMFYHKPNSLAASNIESNNEAVEIFTNLSNLDIIPNAILSNNGKADIVGLSISYDKQFSEGLSFNSNASF